MRRAGPHRARAQGRAAGAQVPEARRGPTLAWWHRRKLVVADQVLSLLPQNTPRHRGELPAALLNPQDGRQVPPGSDGLPGPRQWADIAWACPRLLASRVRLRQ